MATSTPIDPTAAALNAARDVAIRSGKDPYGGTLKTLASFSQPLSASSAPAPIPATTMQASQTPYEISTTPAAPTTSNLALTNNAAAAQAATDMAAVPPNPAKDALNTSLQSIVAGINGQAAQEDQIRAENRIYEKKQKATALSNEMDRLDKGYRDEVQQIKAQNPNGIGAEVMAQKLAQAEDRYQNNRANLALTYKVAADDYNGALQIVNDKISSLDKQHANQLSAYQLAAAAVNNDLTESEKLTVQANLQAQQQERTSILSAYSEVLKNAASNGAPASVLSAIDAASRAPGASAAAVFAAAGSYAKDPQVRLAESKARAELSTGNVTITNPAASPYGGILQTILASGAYTKDQKASIIAGINNGSDPMTVIKNQAKNIMGQTLATDLDKAEQAKTQLVALDGLMKEYYANGGTTGIFTGNFENTINKLGKVKNPKLVTVASRIALAMQSYRLAVTGTAASVQEDTRIDNVFPGITNSQGLNQARMDAQVGYFDTKIDSAYSNTLGTGTYQALKKADQQGVKGSLSSPDFVERTLKAKGLSYDDAIAKTPPGQKAVIDNKTGKVGYIQPYEYDPKLYTPL
jgi:hypothetical protein